jgi:hypothetical protein
LAEEQAKQELARFSKFFAKTYRGETRTKPDTAITAADIADILKTPEPGTIAKYW